MLLTVKEAAQRLGISTTLLYALCNRRKIRHERHGLGRGKILIPDEALEEYRQGQTVPVETEAGSVPPPLKHITLAASPAGRPHGGARPSRPGVRSAPGSS